MHTSLASLLAALLTVAAPPPPTQTPTVRSPGDSTVSEVGGKTYKQWAEDLKHPDASIREEAIRALALFGHDSLRAIPLFIDRLQDPDASPRVKAAIVLGMLDIPKEDIPKVVQALGQRLLNDRQSIVRYYAAAAIVNFGEDGRYAQAGLVSGASDQSTWEIRHACIAALRSAGRDPSGAPNPHVERALISAMHDPTYRVRLEAILAIGALGKPDDHMLMLTLVQALQDRLTDRDAAVKIWAHVALMVIDEVYTDKSLQAVIKYFKHIDPKVRIEAARALGAVCSKIKAKAGVVEPALTAALHDKEVTVIAAAARALTLMDELTGPARDSLLETLKNPDANVRASVAQAIGSGGTKGRPAVRTLVELIQDKEQPPYVVASACWALGEIGEPDPLAEAALSGIGQRKDADESLKLTAEKALEQMHRLKK